MHIDRQKILFLCSGNSCRSQMAEGWGRHLYPDQYEFFSAGIETHGLNPLAVEVMGEAGVDISTHHSKLLSELDTNTFDYVITVCDHAHEQCPIFPGKGITLHHQFPDPPLLAQTASNDEEALSHYRTVRDLIQEYLLSLPVALVSPRE